MTARSISFSVLGDSIGKGSFGVVYKGSFFDDDNTFHDVAIKVC